MPMSESDHAELCGYFTTTWCFLIAILLSVKVIYLSFIWSIISTGVIIIFALWAGCYVEKFCLKQHQDKKDNHG